MRETDINLKRMGKYVSMLLRHHPEEAGVVLDEHGCDFYRSTSGVWLTDAVPFKYMKEI